MATRKKQGPKRAKGVRGARGRTPPVSEEELVRRRQVIRGALANRLDRPQVYAVMHQQFGMSPTMVKSLIAKVRVEQLQEDPDRQQYARIDAVERLNSHIVQARQDRKWSAVASLEGQLARIEGTEQRPEQQVTMDVTLKTAVLHVLANESPERVHELVEEQLAVEGLLEAPDPKDTN
jgi:hypothetical protein